MCRTTLGGRAVLSMVWSRIDKMYICPGCAGVRMALVRRDLREGKEYPGLKSKDVGGNRRYFVMEPHPLAAFLVFTVLFFMGGGGATVATLLVMGKESGLVIFAFLAYIPIYLIGFVMTLLRWRRQRRVLCSEPPECELKEKIAGWTRIESDAYRTRTESMRPVWRRVAVVLIIVLLYGLACRALFRSYSMGPLGPYYLVGVGWSIILVAVLFLGLDFWIEQLGSDKFTVKMRSLEHEKDSQRNEQS